MPLQAKTKLYIDVTTMNPAGDADITVAIDFGDPFYLNKKATVDPRVTRGVGISMGSS